MRRANFAVLIALLFLTGLAGCAEKAPPKVEPVEVVRPPVVADLEHQVGSGETLAMIATWYTGSGKNWSAIKEANPGLNAKRLRRGQVIVIPGPLLTRREPMPRSFAKSAAKSVAKKVPEAVRQEEAPVAIDSGTRDSGDADIVEKSIDLGSSNKPPAVEESWKKDDVPVPPEKPAAGDEELLGSGTVKMDPPAKLPPEPDMPATTAAKKGEAPSAKADSGTPPQKPASGGGGSDAEREKLLDELLSQ